MCRTSAHLRVSQRPQTCGAEGCTGSVEVLFFYWVNMTFVFDYLLFYWVNMIFDLEYLLYWVNMTFNLEYFVYASDSFHVYGEGRGLFLSKIILYT